MLQILQSVLSRLLLLTLHLQNSSSFPPPLPAAKERELLERYRKTGDRDARALLIEHNLRLVAHIMKKYYAAESDQEDLVSIGTIGLIKAVDSFDPDKGTRLATYAARCIENEILMHFRAQRKSAGDVSLSEALDSEDEDGNLSFLDVVAQEDDLAERVGLHELCGKLRRAVDTLLGEREARIVRLRYGLDGGEALTQAETAQCCGISRSYVSRIEKKALEKLRAALEDEN